MLIVFYEVFCTVQFRYKKIGIAYKSNIVVPFGTRNSELKVHRSILLKLKSSVFSFNLDIIRGYLEATPTG